MLSNDIPEHLDTIRVTEKISPLACWGPLFADDVTVIISDSAPDPLRRWARSNQGNVETAFGLNHLELRVPKTHNTLLGSKTLPQGVYRRAPPVSLQTTKTHLR